MAVAATISTLTEELVATVAKLDSKDTPRSRNLKRRAEESFKSNAYARTNQFAVASQLDGLQEKFQVLNKDDLADALRSRLTELEDHRSSWFPEILSLLLQLADRPAQLSRLDRIEQPKHEQVKPVSWNDLDAAGSAFCDEDIWEAVDFGAESSDEDLRSVSSVGHSRNLPQTSVVPDEDYVIPDDAFSPLDDEDVILSIKSAQFWRDENHHKADQHQKFSSRVITELQVVREAIFMLQGLPTSMFWRLDDSIEVDRRYKLAQVSDETFLPLLRTLCSIGARLDILRRFVRLPQTIAHVQTFHRDIEDCLRGFDEFLSTVQSKYLSQNETVAVSLLQLSEDVHRESRLLLLLTDIVSKLKRSGSENPVRCLDLLYDLVCMAQATGYDDEFRILAKMFFSCFKTYARPINLWMETGELKDSVGGTLFILDNRNDSDLRTLWHDWYTLDGASRLLSVPKFIQPLARKIFITGKSTVFLQHLNVFHEQEHTRETPLTFEDVFPQDASSLYLPFSALLESAFGRMVDRQHSLKSSWLRQELDQQCGLWTSLEALEHIYLCKDMSVVGPIDNKIFELIDRGRGAWSDRFLLTELAQSAFSTLPVIDPSRLIVRSNKDTRDKLNGRHRSVKILETISFDYILPWPVANIITKDAILGYRRISTILMQIRRAMYTVQKQRLQYSDRPDKISGKGTNPLDYILRHNMLWFLNTLYSHMTGFVVSTAVESLRKALDDANDVDAMIAAHRSHMVSLEEQCLLSQNLHALYQAIITLLDLCVSFADLQATMKGASQPEWSKSSRHDYDDEDDDEDSDDPDADGDTMAPSVHESQYDERLHDIKNQFDRLIAFMTAGLKGIGRVDGQLSWEILAEKLEWRKARLNGV
ncbi:hypothetical protein P170DRAFT_433876 [Aspergillus steynii IBT 23096]|uniref:Spindle pole body component n=1 Tax=Aspergillus steynii IBT 23096 TaxID=1392250 RepID=A0A2I2GGH9_9EURO|nr:uncharacterized protein P170DRAFT_433876 [Aspergillus steynii IBT 23096]PLB51976.1 hypothetical protein P170DRAFT_433876 [Aspergillus steynii IBT 23096]